MNEDPLWLYVEPMSLEGAQGEVVKLLVEICYLPPIIVA